MPYPLHHSVLADPRMKAGRLFPKGLFKLDRCTFFLVADLLFLAVAGVGATLAMHMIHQLEWPFVPTSLVGMVAVMLVQTVLAFGAAPLLGSIESMVPSMIVAMVSPMTLCVLHLFGCPSTWPMAAMIGIGFAIALSVFIGAYGRMCKRAFATGHEPMRS